MGGMINVINCLKNQIMDLKIKTDEKLFLFYERTNKLKEDSNYLTQQSMTFDLIRDIKNRFIPTEDGSYQLTLDEAQNLSKLYFYQNFKVELDNITERAFFAIYRNIAFVEIFIEQKDMERAIYSLCEGYQIYGMAIAPNNKYIFNAIDSIVISKKNREIAKIKAKKGAEINRPMYEQIEKAWLNGWQDKKATHFADYIIYHPKRIELVGSATRDHLLKHARKLKNQYKKQNPQN